MNAQQKKELMIALAFMAAAVQKITRVKIETSPKELDALIDKYTPSLKKQLYQYWLREQNSITNSVISQWVTTGTFVQDYSVANTIEASNLPGYAKSYFIAFREWLRKATIDALQRYSRKIRLQVYGGFIENASTQRLFDFIESEALQYAKFLTRSRTLTLRKGLEFIVTNDLGIAEGAALMQENMVLTPKMAAGVRKSYLRDLENGLTKKQALARARAKSENAKLWRSNLQIRTELNRAKQEADREAIKQAMAKGIVSDVWKEWERNTFIAAINHKNSIDNDGISVPEDDVFPDGSLFPNEFNENCTLSRFMTKTVR